jgi:anti-sigma regulatory factor (Ser/Thr protein kinase)
MAGALGAVPDGAEAQEAVLAELVVPSAEGNERLAMEAVGDLVEALGMEPSRLDRLRTAVAEATMNAMEHGSRYAADRPVTVRVLSADGAVRVQVVDLGQGAPQDREAEVPDIEKKLAGLQRPRGWGLFLIRSMVDDVRESTDGHRHVVELVMHLDDGHPEGDDDGDA